MFDDLKKIAGVHTGAAPHPLLKIPAHAAPPVTSHASAPVQRIAMNPSAPVQRPPAPSPAPMPKLGASGGNAAPPRHLSTSAANSSTVASALASHGTPQKPAPLGTTAPLSVVHLQATSPALASLAAAAGIVAASPSSAPSLPSLIATSSSATAPSSGSDSMLVDRAPSASQASSQNFAGAGSDARGFERVARSAARPKNAQGMPPLGTTQTRGGTTEGRTTMGYRGTGEKTYCPINSAGNVAANSQATLPGVRPSKPFQGQQLLIDPSLWAVFNIVDIKLGNEPVAVTAGAVSAGCFPPSKGPEFEWKVADGVDIIFTVANVTATATPFSALIRGEVCEKTS